MIEGRELILSASSISSYLRCGYAYYLGNVLRVPSPPNMDMAVGSAVHAGVEALHKGSDGLQATVAALGTQLDSMSEPFSESPVTALRGATEMYGVYRDKIAPTFKPVMVERAFVVRLNGVLVSGQIDVADDQDQVRDTKTTRLLSKFRAERHRLQLSLYGVAFRALTGRKPRRLLLDVVARNLRWKTVPIEPDEGELADVISLTAGGMIRGEYEPTGALNGSCARCAYLEVCSFAVTD